MVLTDSDELGLARIFTYEQKFALAKIQDKQFEEVFLLLPLPLLLRLFLRLFLQLLLPLQLWLLLPLLLLFLKLLIQLLLLLSCSFAPAPFLLLPFVLPLLLPLSPDLAQVRLPLAQFRAFYRGQEVEDAPPLDLAKVPSCTSFFTFISFSFLLCDCVDWHLRAADLRGRVRHVQAGGGGGHRD